MHFIAGFSGALLILAILWDGFETIILPRRVNRQIRLTRLFYRATWIPWSAMTRNFHKNSHRETFVSYFGPLSLIILLILWAICLMIGFALIQWSLGSQLSLHNGLSAFEGDLYLSVNSFFTMGFGDVAPLSTTARLLALLEGGVGYGFLALVIGYLPALNNAFSHREVNVSMLDERAGTPPTAFRLLVSSHAGDGFISVNQFLMEWERWSAELMESHLSYPVLAYFRSQHQNQSWVSALTMVLDLSALVLAGIGDQDTEPARLAFAMARHTAVDLTQVFNTHPRPPQPDRLPPDQLDRLRQELANAGVELRAGSDTDRRLTELRELYEPYMEALAHHLIVSLPPWLPAPDGRDNWQTTAWEH